MPDMKDRRVSPRARCSISLNYKLLDETAQQRLLDEFSGKRKHLMIYDQLDHSNKKEHFRLQTLENEMAPLLIGLSNQLRLLIDTLVLDLDMPIQQDCTDVVVNVGGMQFQTDTISPQGSVLELQLRLDLSTPRILIMAEVLRSEQADETGKISTIVAFTYIEQEDKTRLKVHVDKKIQEDSSIVE